MIISNYIFDASAQKITFKDRVLIEPERIGLITNNTQNQVIYQFNKMGYGYTDITGNELTLEYDTTTMSDDDEIMIVYKDANENGADMGRITEYNSTITVVPKSVIYGPFTLTTLDEVTDVIDLGRFAEVNVEISLTSPDFIQIDFSTNGYNGWTQYGAIGNSGSIILPKYKRFFRMHRISTSGNAMTVTITANSIPTQLGSSTNGRSVTLTPITMGMSGLNSNSAYVRSARSQADQVSGDELIANAQHGYVGTNLYDKVRVANLRRSATATASGNTAVWTPASGKKFRLMKYMIEVPSNTTLAVAGVLTIDLRDSNTTTQLTHKVYLDTTGYAQGNVLQTPWIDLGNGYISSTANNVLNVNLSSAVNAGLVNVIVAGIEE